MTRSDFYPVTITLKLLFQEICVANIGCDESIGMLENKWVNIVKVICTYADMAVQRSYFVYDIYDPITSIFLHGYSDAAEKAFAACITKSGNVKVSIVTAKSRVKPIRKDETMPQLELLGNLIIIIDIFQTQNWFTI